MAYYSTETAMSRPGSGVVSPQQKIRSRTQSISSDRPSTVGHGMMSPPLPVSPEAVFIAASAASQIVTNDHDSHVNTWYDDHGIEPSGEPAVVSALALQLVNNFLDQLLFNFLAISRSTSLTALRPAVSDVLKPKLAKDAINQADEELREYLGGGDDDDMLQSQTVVSPRDWDLELVWKRTRLRCMVYSSLGDMEEEDEDFYMEQEQLDAGSDDLGETVSPAVAIFLTSILEFMGEQALISASQAAYHRMRFIYEKGRSDAVVASPAPIADRVSVEEVDMERVAFDRTIGRLWRAWKKRIRSPTDSHASLHRPSISEFGRSTGHYRGASLATDDGATIAEAGSRYSGSKDKGKSQEKPRDSIEEERADDSRPKTDEEWLSLAMSLALPTNERDIAEILMPGFACYSDDEDDANRADDENSGDGEKKKLKKRQMKDKAKRPRSLMISPLTAPASLPTPTMSQPCTPEMQPPRKRANSLPTPSMSPYLVPEPTDSTGDAGNESTPASAPTPAPVLVPAGTAEENHSPVAVPDEKVPETVTVSEKQKRLQIAPLQTALIGAAITTVSPRAVPIGSVAAKEDADQDDEVDGEIDEFTEEPQILTSSRVSMSGRSNSPTASEHGRSISVNTGLPNRPASIHSPRVIEVMSPRSPMSRARSSFIEALDTHSLPRTSSNSRNSSVSSTPIAEEGQQSGELISAPRAFHMVPRVARSHTSESISEEEEISAEPTTQPIFGSVPRHTDSSSPKQSYVYPPPPATVPKVDGASTKVTILNSSVSHDTSFIESRPPVPAKNTREAAHPVMAPVPERSPKRQGISGNTAAMAAVSVAATTGAVTTMHGTNPRRDMQPPSPRTVERPSMSSNRDQVRADQQAQLQGHSLTQGATRQLSHTSASSTSSSNKLKPKRTSEESSRATRAVDVARNFEQLIHSDETIQYTLTPESMRDIDGTRPSNDSNSIRIGGDRSRSSSINTRQIDVKRSVSMSRKSESATNNGKLNGPVPRSPHGLAPSISSTSTKVRPNGPQAREARVPQESMADFADFIRGTGPIGGHAGPGPVSGPGPRKGSLASASMSSGMRNASSPANMTKQSMDSARATTSGSSSRRRYLAREATVDKDDNSDLIDFIRRGPPSSTAGNPRIPRTVAPFRSTMDSDQMAGAVGGRAVDATIPTLRYSASTNVTDSSMGSSTGLLRKDKPVSHRPSGSNSNFFGEPEMTMPKRKTRRVRDPYAIDLSDEDEEELYDPRPPAARHGGGGGGRPTAKEESLLDFLNSVPPPVETPPVAFDTPQTRSLRQAPRKKGSAPSLMARFTRSSGNGNTSPRLPFGSSHKGSNSIVDSRSLSSRAGSIAGSIAGRSRGHVPLQVNMPGGYDKYGVPVPPLPQGLSNRPVPAPVSGRVPMKKYEARGAQTVSSRATQDLADFFRNSGPGQTFRG